MSITAIGICLVVGLFVAMMLLIELGRRLAVRRRAPDEEPPKPDFKAIEGAVFGLMGLLLAFSFSGALSRWDTRRGHIRDEVNAIGTAYLRLDLLPQTKDTDDLRRMFRDYVDARMTVYSTIKLPAEIGPAREQAAAIQNDIWKRALAACRGAESPQVMPLVVQSLNDMFDMMTTRDLTAVSHPPLVVFLMLAGSVLMSSFLAGFDLVGTNRMNRVHMVGYALMISLTVYVTLEIEFPRLGLVRIDSADAAMLELRASMK